MTEERDLDERTIKTWDGRRPIFLTGMPGSGKTGVGRALARRLDAAFLDTDHLVEAMARMPVPAIFTTRGEAFFRSLERRALALAAGARDVVVATGGGVPVDPRNVRLMRRAGTVVALEASPETLWRRLRKGPADDGNQGGDGPDGERDGHSGDTDRPLLAGPDGFGKLRALHEARRAAYATAHASVNTEGRPVGAVAEAVLVCLGARDKAGAVGPVRPVPSLRIRAGSSDYVYYDFPGVLAFAGELLGQVKKPPRRVLCVSTPLVWGLFGSQTRESLASVGYHVFHALVPDGEAAKSKNHLDALYHTGLQSGLSRSDVVLALGGGAVGDLAGFFAATFLRGLTFVQAPTTVLAQADSSVGGKVAINLRAGPGMYKNMVGAFHQPALVIADPSALRHLPPRQVRNGLAEVIKAAVIGDPAAFTDLERWLGQADTAPPRGAARAGAAMAGGAGLAPFIRAAVAVKAAVVATDERDEGPRQVLNLGHTLGHALEAAVPGRYLHGEAVSLGLVAAARVAAGHGLLAEKTVGRIRRVLAGAGLPVTLADGASDPAMATRREILTQALVEAMSKDKKRDAKGVRLVLPFAIGDCRVVADISPQELVLAAFDGGPEPDGPVSHVAQRKAVTP